MDFFKVKKFRKAHKPEPETDAEDKPVPLPGDQTNENGNVGKSAYVDTTSAEPEDDDDDFITNEVKRRLKELRRNSFMVLIPEESAPEDEEADDEEEQANMNPGDWRDVEAEGRQFWSGFNAVYDKYSEQMLFYDRLQAQQLREFGSDQQKLEDDELPVLASDLLKVIESSILTFRLFVKMDKKSGTVRNLFGSQNQMSTPLHQIQCSLEKKKVKLKELRKRKKNLKKKSWPTVPGDVDLLLGLIDVKVMNRVLRMERINKEQLFWCEEKMKKLDINDSKLQRDPSIILFPC